MTALRLLALAAAFVLAAPLGAGAQDAPAGDAAFDLGGGQPIEISADNGIEWNRDAKSYTARGNAVAVQGTSEIHADTLIASYSTSSSQIDHVVAEGAVKIMNPSQTAYGDHADFDQTRRVLVMTGTALMIVSADQTVTARDAFEYWQDQDALVAKGDVVIVKSDGTRISGDTVTSYFRKNAGSGKREAFQVKAEGNVRIDTGTFYSASLYLAGTVDVGANRRFDVVNGDLHFAGNLQASGSVTVDGQAIKLTSHELRLLSYLMHHKGKVVSRTELTEHLYDQDFDRDSNTIEVFVGRLRKKLPEEVIHTVRGLGYQILED